MAAAGYSSVRRSSTSSSDSGSDYHHHHHDNDNDDDDAYNTDAAGARRRYHETNTSASGRDTKDHGAAETSSPSSRPSISTSATPSPLNFLSLASPTFTPLSMDSDLFREREHDGKEDEKNKNKIMNSSSPSPAKQASGATKLAATSIPPPPPSTAAAAVATSSSSSSHDARSNTSLNLDDVGGSSATPAMRAPHATTTQQEASSAAEKQGDVSGARGLDAEAPAAGREAEDIVKNSRDANNATTATSTSSYQQDMKEDEDRNAGLPVPVPVEVQPAQVQPVQGDEEQEQEAISHVDPRQRFAGSTPLSLDPLQVARGSSAATDTSAANTAASPSTTATSTTSNTADTTNSSTTSPTNQHHLQHRQHRQQQQHHYGSHYYPYPPPANTTSVVPAATTALPTPPASASASASASAPPLAIQPIAPLALRTKNINSNSQHHANTSSVSITSPLSAASNISPSTVLSAPAAFTRQLSTSSSRSNSILISQIQDGLQQQQYQHQRNSRRRGLSSSSGSNAVHRPVPKPIVRTTSDSDAFILKHPIPDLNCRSGAYVGNVAALEKTAERLSMTSSIEDAIRDLHGELKRSDSRRSSILAASVAASQSQSQSPVDDSASQQPGPLRVIPPVASIVELNNAARLGGYSPSGYVMSPNHSLTGRLRSGSKNSASGRPEIDVDAIMSRHGPGKSSTRSARSARPSLAEISETEPVALTQRALDEADRAPLADDDATIRRPSTHYEENNYYNSTGSGNNHNTYNDMIGGQMHEPSGLGLDFGGGGDGGRRLPDDRPPTPRSTATYDPKTAFDDFDGVHCQPDQYSERGWDSREKSDNEYPEPPPPKPKTMPMPDIPEPPFEPEPQPRMPRVPRASQARPQSYFDELTGQEMLYYPARVPAMLNLPPKLSKKPKAEVRNARHSRVLQAMGHPGFGKAEYLPQDPEAPPVRESKMWLPDPLAGHGMTTLGDDLGGERSAGGSIKEPAADSRVDSQVPAEQGDSLLADEIPQPPPPAQQRRKSKMPRNSDLPPQLRASAFFDQPSTTPQIEIKDGSAMATLDSILDASANAPVSAFTDHAFAGKLGAEVYGPDKKQNRKSAAPGALLPEEHRAASQKKRGGLMPFGKKSSDESRKNSLNAQGEETRALSDNVDGGSRKSGEQSDEEEEEEDEFAHVLDGPPTTLLAELQLRKYQAKMRTQMPNSAIPGGMHSTLLELDAVAEAQKRHREKKKIALAWEDGADRDDHSSDEDEVPLGVLYANQGALAERNRPIGLMERREMEENEPLSARRARLQGQEPPRTLAKQRSNFTLNAGLGQLRLHHQPSAERIRPQEESDDETAGETLGERMRRLRAKDEAEHNNLPKARPVSKAFSAEILTAFGDPEEEGKGKGKEEEEEVPPEEETLGQRRKRLQAEKEAREREMTLGAGGGPIPGISDQPQVLPQLRKQHSLADVLATHPVLQNPAVEQERHRQEEERKVRAQEVKMAAVRSQMPTTLDGPKGGARAGGYKNGQFNDGSGGGLISTVPSSNAGVGVSLPPAPGGLNHRASMGGLNNRASMAFSSYGAPMQMPMQQQQQQQQQPAYGGLIGQAGITQMANNPTMAGGYGGYAGGGMGGMTNMNNMSAMTLNPYGGGMGMQMPMQMQQGMAPMGMNMNMNMGMGMGMGMQQGMQQGMTPMQMQQMQMQMQPGQLQSIERWRQSIHY